MFSGGLATVLEGTPGFTIIHLFDQGFKKFGYDRYYCHERGRLTVPATLVLRLLESQGPVS